MHHSLPIHAVLQTSSRHLQELKPCACHEACPCTCPCTPLHSHQAAQLKLHPQWQGMRSRLLQSLVLRACKGEYVASRVGDGDCGTTLAQGAKAIQADCSNKYPLNDAAAAMSAVAESVGHSMGGSSGALYQIFFVALAGQGCCARFFALGRKALHSNKREESNLCRGC